MSNLRRTTIAGIGLVSSLVLVGCAGSSGTESPESDTATQGQSPSSSQAPSGPEIDKPKNAAAVGVCSLLPPDAAGALGVKPQGEKNSNDLSSDLPAGCMWQSPDGAKAVGLTAIDDRPIKSYYRNAKSYVDFQKITVAGYPAVRANKVDPMTGGSCDIFLATKKNQVVYAYARTPEVGQVDPCKISKKALTLSVSSWPAAK